MTQKDRTEVRDMLHDILSGWQAGNTAQADVTNAGLAKIDDHLTKLNGKVAEHERIINIHLPHSINTCAQKETITSIRDNMITTKALKQANRNTIVTTGAVCTILFIIFQVITKLLAT